MSNNSKKYSFHSEAFVYLWFDAKNRMFYLGYHKGHPDDHYTHSSAVMESFTKTTIPSYMHRRILATGTEQEMLDLENKLLDNRKEKCWDKYYNATVAFPPPPMYGENHPMWKGGIWSDPEKRRENYARNRDKIREKRRENYARNRDKIREKRRENYAKNVDKILEQKREYYEKNVDKIREYQREYLAKNRDKILEKRREYRAKNRDKIREQKREYRAKKKAEKAAGKVHFGD